MPESNICKFDDRILLPAILTSCQPCREDQVILLHSMPSAHAFGLSPEIAKAYFLAQITMARMIRRCTTSVIVSQAKEVYAPIIALELTYQLQTWHHHLPPSIRFECQDTTSVLPDDFLETNSSFRASSVIAVTQVLQMQYYLCLTNIYWPAVYSVINTGTLTPAPTDNCAQFFDSYVGFVMTAASVINNRPQNPWISIANCANNRALLISLFITTMACFKGASSLCLRSTTPPNVTRCFDIASKLFETGDAVAVSPAIGKIGFILRQRFVGRRR
ncbi:Echinocandin B biosynthetic cluster transcription factor [Hyphodiscus hymeniophilus]|uniref:Echinocandin B biosynthetic cluster transcription factor n=1 Tax=Hyphodiscus hymeniophilus TaxID=353542 RepID=A0A9P6VD74_9HELO|nr:Echinocandin B biosynthetic cluster transcription factor [Hyphodiscus hymeniophilus]